MANFGNLFSAPLFSVTYLTGKTFDQDGDEQVEENVVPESHECDKVKRSPVAGSLHAQKEDDVPILLGQNLENSLAINFHISNLFRQPRTSCPLMTVILIKALVLGNH